MFCSDLEQRGLAQIVAKITGDKHALNVMSQRLKRDSWVHGAAGKSVLEWVNSYGVSWGGGGVQTADGNEVRRCPIKTCPILFYMTTSWPIVCNEIIISCHGIIGFNIFTLTIFTYPLCLSDLITHRLAASTHFQQQQLLQSAL